MKTKKTVRELFNIDHIIFEEFGFWFFVDECWSTNFGPFNNREDCFKVYLDYGKYLENKSHGRQVKYSDIKCIPPDEEFDFEKASALLELDVELPVFIEVLGGEYNEDDILNKDLVYSWNNKRKEIKKLLNHDR